MKFGDKVKLTDEFWNELKSIIKEGGGWFSNKLDSLENKFLYVQYTNVTGSDTFWIASLTPELTNACGGVGRTEWRSSFENWSFWIDYKAVSGEAIEESAFDVYHGATKASWPQDWKNIVPKRMITFRMNEGVLPYEDIKTKPIHFGGKCLICKNGNPYMNGDGFCWSCEHDPRNVYKIEEIKEKLVKMASI